MTEPKASNPHNNLFVRTLSHPQEARSLIEHHFPKEVVATLNLDTLEIENDSFVDPELRESFCDLLYSVQLHSKQAAFVYLLFEHKSSPDRMTAFQLLRYVVRIWEKQLGDRQPLSPIFPYVVYHGETPWNAPVSIEELVPTPEPFAPYTVQFRFPILDLSGLPDEELLGNRFVQNLLYVLKYGRSAELERYLARILELLRDPRTQQPDPDRLHTILVYIMSANDHLTAGQLESTVKNVFPLAFEPNSILGRSFKEGREEGREEGLQIGREEGREEGILKGVVAGQIQALQQLLGEPISSLDELVGKQKQDLDTLLSSLQLLIRQRYH